MRVIDATPLGVNTPADVTPVPVHVPPDGVNPVKV